MWGKAGNKVYDERWKDDEREDREKKLKTPDGKDCPKEKVLHARCCFRLNLQHMYVCL
jgi:hypothetical protein